MFRFCLNWPYGAVILDAQFQHRLKEIRALATATQLEPSVESELSRRHKAASTTVLGLIVASVLLCIVAYLSRGFLTEQNNPLLDIALRITILILGLGAVVLRRTRFSSMRLQDIGALEGPSGLLRTLERTTLLVALLGVVTLIMGFAATLMSGNEFYTYGGGLVAIAIFLYCYPVRRAWRRVIQQFDQTEQPAE